MKTRVKVLVVDDSVLFRSQIQAALQSCSELEVLGAASNGKMAIEKMISLQPDLCILDIEMPVMDGIDTLKEMRARGIKTRAIMFSSLNKSGAEKTLEAMRLGAIDFIPKPTADGSNISPADRIRESLLPRIRSLFPGEKPKNVLKMPRNEHWAGMTPTVLVIASSTGGPNALAEFFSVIKGPLPYPILVAQHMPPLFTASLAERIQNACGKTCKEGEHHELLKQDHIYIAPGNFHMTVKSGAEGPMINIEQGPLRNYVRPCADFLFESAAGVYGAGTLGIVFTGMGRDGADGASVIKTAGGAVMIQDEASSIVFGMPGAVNEANLQDFVGSPMELAEKVMRLSKGKTHVA